MEFFTEISKFKIFLYVLVDFEIEKILDSYFLWLCSCVYDVSEK